MSSPGQPRSTVRIGDLVYDIERAVIGRVAYLDRGGNIAWIAPEEGGSEWLAFPERLRPVRRQAV